MIQIIGVQVSIYTRFDYPWLSEKNQCYTDVIILVYYRFILTVQRFFSPNTDFFNIHFSNQISLFHEKNAENNLLVKLLVNWKTKMIMISCVRCKWLEMYTFFVNLHGKCISSQTTYKFLILPLFNGFTCILVFLLHFCQYDDISYQN